MMKLKGEHLVHCPWALSADRKWDCVADVAVWWAIFFPFTYQNHGNSLWTLHHSATSDYNNSSASDSVCQCGCSCTYTILQHHSEFARQICLVPMKYKVILLYHNTFEEEKTWDFQSAHPLNSVYECLCVQRKWFPQMAWGLDPAIKDVLFQFWDVENLCEYTRKFYLSMR